MLASQRWQQNFETAALKVGGSGLSWGGSLDVRLIEKKKMNELETKVSKECYLKKKYGGPNAISTKEDAMRKPLPRQKSRGRKKKETEKETLEFKRRQFKLNISGEGKT